MSQLRRFPYPNPAATVQTCGWLLGPVTSAPLTPFVWHTKPLPQGSKTFIVGDSPSSLVVLFDTRHSGNKSWVIQSYARMNTTTEHHQNSLQTIPLGFPYFVNHLVFRCPSFVTPGQAWLDPSSRPSSASIFSLTCGGRAADRPRKAALVWSSGRPKPAPFMLGRTDGRTKMGNVSRISWMGVLMFNKGQHTQREQRVS